MTLCHLAISNQHYCTSNVSLHTPPPRQHVRQPYSPTATQFDDNDRGYEYDVDAYEYAHQQQLVNSNHSDDEYDVCIDEYEHTAATNCNSTHTNHPATLTTTTKPLPLILILNVLRKCDLSPIQIPTPTTLHTTPPPEQQNIENDTDYTTTGFIKN